MSERTAPRSGTQPEISVNLLTIVADLCSVSSNETELLGKRGVVAVSIEDIQSEFAGQWVALKDDEVISVGPDPEAMSQELDYRGITDYEVLDCPEEPVY